MTKILKNPARSTKKEVYTPYVPQYKMWGVEPIPAKDDSPFKNAGKPVIVNGNKSMNKQETKLKLKPLATPITKSNVPYAETISVMDKNASLPNVGNNIESVWNSVDNNMVIDDISHIDSEAQMIDNNDYYTDEALGISTEETIMQEQVSEITSENIDLNEDEYLIAIEGTVISSGPLDMIENAVKALIFGEHELCGGKQIPIEDIIVLKRVKIKMGVFING